MGVYIKGMEMPKGELGAIPVMIYADGHVEHFFTHEELGEAVLVPPHGRMIDADALRQEMYHQAFEADTPMQKWDSGCWIRYKMFENALETAPTIIPAEEGE